MNSSFCINIFDFTFFRVVTKEILGDFAERVTIKKHKIWINFLIFSN
jgi:hypothetical protein